MFDVLVVAFFSLLGGVISLAGGFFLLANEKRAYTLLKYVTPFAAGALLAAAFIDLLPEATHQGDAETALRWTLGGIVAFFLLERFVRWFHRSHAHDGDDTDATAPLIIIGDTVHNFIDGIAIAAAFLIDIPTGIITTIAVAAHEIPQEVGDFGLLLQKGLKRRSVIMFNILSALATALAAVGFFLVGQNVNVPLDMALGLVAGFFIYIAVSDIIPSIHKTQQQRLAGYQTAMLIIGIIVVGFATTTLHGYIDSATPSENHDDHSHKLHDEHDH